jgi:hypothetical protein
VQIDVLERGVTADRRFQSRGRALGYDGPVVDDRDALAEPVALFHVVRGQHQREP